MEAYLDVLDAKFGELVSRISRLEPVDNQPSTFEALDRELVGLIQKLKLQYDACRRIEDLKAEGNTLDAQINDILIDLAQCRRELADAPDRHAADPIKIDSSVLLAYATKITRFTKQLPGAVDPSVLPWPGEDQLRRGMLATLTIHEEQGDSAEPGAEHPQPEESETSQPEPSQTEQPPRAESSQDTAPAPRAARKQAAPKQKISLDFDSDED